MYSCFVKDYICHLIFCHSGTMRTTSSLAKYILRSWQVFRLKIIVLAPSQFPSFPVVYCLDSLSRRRDRSGFAPDSNLRSDISDHHEIMRFVFLIFVFLLCNICYLVVKIFEYFYRISPFVSITFYISQFYLLSCWINTVVASVDQSGHWYKLISFCFDISDDLL